MIITPRRNFALCEKVKTIDERTKTGIVLPGEEGSDKFAFYKILKISEESEWKFELGDRVLCQQDYENKITIDGKKLYMLDTAYFIAVVGG